MPEIWSDGWHGFVTHMPTGKKMEETIGPAYWSKKKWQREREQALARLKKALTP